MYLLGDLSRIDHRLALTLFLLLLITYSRLQQTQQAEAVSEAFHAKGPDTLHDDMVAAARGASSFLEYLKTVDSGELAAQSQLHPQYREPEFWLAQRDSENNVVQE